MTSSTPLLRYKAGATFNIPVELDLRENSGELVHAHLLQVNTGFFQLTSPVFLQSNTIIDIIFDRKPLEVEIIFCKADGHDGYAVGARLLASPEGEARREPRIPIEINARFTTSDLGGFLPAKLTDISRSGLGLKIPKSIPVGSGAIVEIPTGIAFGEVRHCSQQGSDCWRVGLSLDEFVAHRSRKPKHSSVSGGPHENPGLGLPSLLKRMFGLE
jgi:hypothetical protein